ncbi:MAG: gluconate 5-dehydrogenase [Phycisphaerae bacterium]|jgi:gluconate 5-dehydrogenase|nr:MAG: gluconate 5-dehydrogenase [Phycisphaerae bacterium]
MTYPDFSVKNRVALVTGSARGIGLAIVQALASAGARVVIQDIDKPIAEIEAQKILSDGGQAVAVGGDCTNLEQASAIVSQVRERFGVIDILINNAAIQQWDDFLSYPVEQMVRQSYCNMLFPVRMCQLVLPGMIERKWGRIINISSVQSLLGNAAMPVYAMSKSAIENLTRGLARRYAKDGITVNAIGPGWFKTDRTAQDFQTPEQIIENGKRVPAGRVGFPEDCAGLAVLLCSRAGEYITGQTIYVDGGLHLR